MGLRRRRERPSGAALGCTGLPGGFELAAPHHNSAARFFPALGTICTDLRSAVRVEQPVVIVAWPLGSDGRKLHAGTAILGEDGAIRAIARQSCIAMPIDWAGAQ